MYNKNLLIDMPRMTFSIVLPKWLAQWYVHRTGGQIPVIMPRNSTESLLVQTFAQRKTLAPAPDIAEGDAIEIVIPENKAKPADTYSYISPRVKELVRKAISDSFEISLHFDIIRHQFPGRLKKEIIETWMEQHGIEITETNWFAVEKRFDRRRAAMHAAARAANYRKNKKNNRKKHPDPQTVTQVTHITPVTK